MSSKFLTFLILNFAFVVSPKAQDWLRDIHDTASLVQSDGLVGKVRNIKEARYNIEAKDGKIISSKRDINYTMYTNLYNEAGKQVEYTTYDYLDSVDYIHLYRFDDNGYNVRTSIYKSSLDTLFQRLEYKYNNKGKIIETLTTYSGGDTAKSKDKSVKYYDDKDNKIEEDYYYDCITLSDKWMYKYIYTNEGNKLEENAYYLNVLVYPNESHRTLEYSYIYDGRGHLLGTTKFRYGGRREIATYQYDGKGNKIVDVYYDSEDSSTESFFRKYDNEGNIIAVNAYYSDSSRHITYDAKKNIVEINTYNLDSSLREHITFDYVYDDQGNWIKKLRFTNNILISVTVREIGYYK